VGKGPSAAGYKSFLGRRAHGVQRLWPVLFKYRYGLIPHVVCGDRWFALPCFARKAEVNVGGSSFAVQVDFCLIDVLFRFCFGSCWQSRVTLTDSCLCIFFFSFVDHLPYGARRHLDRTRILSTRTNRRALKESWRGAASSRLYELSRYRFRRSSVRQYPTAGGIFSARCEVRF